jgi:hypothetical protein
MPIEHKEQRKKLYDVSNCSQYLKMRTGEDIVLRKESSKPSTTLEKEETRIEPNLNLLFKFDPTPEELDQAARIFAASCWALDSAENVSSTPRKPGSYDIRTGQEVPGEEGDNTWLVTDGEHRAWVTRYGLNRVPLWSVNVQDGEDA